jgi:hypothetical protein
LDREKVALEREEKRLTMEIKKAAKAQQMSSVKIMAKVNCIAMNVYIMVECTNAPFSLFISLGLGENTTVYNEIH